MAPVGGTAHRAALPAQSTTSGVSPELAAGTILAFGFASLLLAALSAARDDGSALRLLLFVSAGGGEAEAGGCALELLGASPVRIAVACVSSSTGFQLAKVARVVYLSVRAKQGRSAFSARAAEKRPCRRGRCGCGSGSP